MLFIITPNQFNEQQHQQRELSLSFYFRANFSLNLRDLSLSFHPFANFQLNQRDFSLSSDLLANSHLNQRDLSPSPFTFSPFPYTIHPSTPPSSTNCRTQKAPGINDSRGLSIVLYYNRLAYLIRRSTGSIHADERGWQQLELRNASGRYSYR